MKKEKDSVQIQLIAGIIGFVGVLLTVLTTIFGPIVQENLRQRNLPTQTSIIIVASPTQALVFATDTVPPGDPTSTPALATDTPVPTFTAVPPVAIGDDWAAGCISSLWMPYPADIATVDKGNGCWQEPVFVFSANAGSLSFLGSRTTNGAEEVYGLFALLPESGTVTVYIHLKDLSNVDLWMGLFAQPDVSQAGILMTIPAGNVKNRLMVQKEIPSYDNISKTQMIDQSDGFIMTFEFSSSSARAIANQGLFITNPVSIPSAQKWLFLGYKSLSGNYRIDGEFSHINIQGSYDPEPTSTSPAIEPTKPTSISSIIPNSTETLQAAFDEFDRQFKDSPLSNIVYNAPETMNLDETVTIELLLNPSLSQGELATQFVDRGNFNTSTPKPAEIVTDQNGNLITSTPELPRLVTNGGGNVDVVTSQIEITNRMKAVLKSQDSDAFVVTELHDSAEQPISNIDTTKWRWSVTAKQAGSKTLELVIYRLIKYENNEYWREVETYKADIVVRVTPLLALKQLDWKWVLGILLTALLIPLFFRWYDARKKTNEADTTSQFEKQASKSSKLNIPKKKDGKKNKG